jgi:Flp pilus assembly protein TadD
MIPAEFAPRGITMADRTSRSFSQYAGAGLGAILLSACAATGEKGDIIGYGKNADYKDAIGVYSSPAADPNGMDPIAAAAFWGAAYDRAPQDPKNAVNYSAALRKIGSTKEAVAVMTKSYGRFPNDTDVNLEYGKALVEEGRAFEAVRYLEIASDDRRNDWRAVSAYGVALDQIGEHKLARAKYDEALALAPQNATVLNNKGLSFALDGDLSSAIKTLRAATANRGADARVRQNLALTLAINGDMREAERLARSDLPPQVAEQNVAYFRQLVTQPAFWQDYAAGASEAPDFDAPAADAQPKAAPARPKTAPKLKEEPKGEKKDPDSPVALVAPTPPTNASAAAAPATSDAANQQNAKPAADAKSKASADAAPELKK